MPATIRKLLEMIKLACVPGWHGSITLRIENGKPSLIERHETIKL